MELQEAVHAGNGADFSAGERRVRLILVLVREIELAIRP